MKKVGIIRCQQTEDICGGATDFKVAYMGIKAFAEFGQCEVIGFVSCGGCPGKKAIARAKMLVAKGADIIAIASCISKGKPAGIMCGNAEGLVKALKKSLGKEIILLDYTH